MYGYRDHKYRKQLGQGSSGREKQQGERPDSFFNNLLAMQGRSYLSGLLVHPGSKGQETAKEF